MPQGVIPPPPGVTPDFEHPVSRNAGTVYTLASIGIVISTLCLSMRIYTKVRIQRIFGADDTCIIIAWVGLAATQFVMIYDLHSGGGGIHLWDMTMAKFKTFQKFSIVAAVLYIPAITFAKLSLLLLYHRLSPERRFRIVTRAIMVVVISYTIALVFAAIFACHPIQRAWDASITTGSCINRPALYLAIAGINTVTDLAILIVPIPMVMGLKIPKIQKIGLMLMFLVGSATFITSIVRLVTLIPLFTATDQSWALAVPSIWVVVEGNLVIICGCLPTIRQFLRRVAPKWIGEDSRHGRIGAYGRKISATTRHSRHHFSHPGTGGRCRIPEDAESAGNHTEWPMRKGSHDSKQAILQPAEAVVLRESLKGGY